MTATPGEASLEGVAESPRGGSPEPTAGSSDEVSIQEIEQETGVTEEPTLPPLARVGYKIFLWLLLLILLLALLLMIYAWWTYPRLGDVVALVAEQPDVDPLQAWRDTRAEWVTQFKDLGQLFLVSPVIPLLGAVLGYIFGRQQAGQAGAPEGET